MIAALFVDKTGCYSQLTHVDIWDESRDARKYQGPYPVVAHPPCQLWGSLAYVNYKRWGGEHNKPGNDQECFKSALDSVLQWGGVLEHPAFTRAWKTYDLKVPEQNQWTKEGEYYVCEVWQSAYGHLATKRTWLLYKGNQPPFEMNWSRIKGSHQIGGHDQRGKDRNKPSIQGKKASATPQAFRDTLINLAYHSTVR